MAHHRKRHLEPILRKLLGLSPIVGVIGHRQVGKTTILSDISKHYYTLDDAAEFAEASSRPSEYIKTRAGSWGALDECQTVAALFPALKEFVRTRKQPGQFILSGSVRFTSRAAIKESLTGRIINLDLMPMLMTELYDCELSRYWRNAVEVGSFLKRAVPELSFKSDQLEKYFRTGGLPGVCFVRDASFRDRKIESQIETILDRDIRLIVPTTLPFPSLMLLLRELAKRQGEVLSMTDLREASGISIPTIKKLLYAFEALFLIRFVAVEGDGKGPVIYFEDMAERRFLCGQDVPTQDLIAHFLFLHIRGEWIYSATAGLQIFKYQTRAGVNVPLVIRSGQNILGIIPLHGERPSRQEMAAGDSLLRKYNHAKVMFVGLSAKHEVLDERRLVTSLGRTFT